MLIIIESQDELKKLLESESNQLNNGAKLHLACFYMHIGKFVDALKYVEMVDEKYKDEYLNPIVLKGWINVMCGKEIAIQSAGAIFDTAISNVERKGKPDLEVKLI